MSATIETMTPQANSARQTRTGLQTLWRWAKRIGVGALALVLALALAGLSYQVLSARRDARRYAPPGALVDVGGCRMHIHATGEGGPTVVLDAGLGDSSLVWFAVQPEVAKFARVCSYDRAGLGWSDASRSPRTSREIVRELHALLANAGIHGPYVLVGHSFGGYNVRLFAHEFPQETAGMVLVDSSHEGQSAKFPPALKQKQRDRIELIKRGALLSPFGIVRLFYVKPWDKLPPTLQPVNVALSSRTVFLTTVCQEMVSFEASAEEVRAGSLLPQVPLAVVTAGNEGEKPWPGVSLEDWEKFQAAWRDLQADLATRCTNSIHFTAVKSSHYVQLDAPAVVVEAIRRVVAAARNHEPLQPVGK